MDSIFKIVCESSGCIKCGKKETLAPYKWEDVSAFTSRNVVKTIVLKGTWPIPVCSYCQKEFNKLKKNSANWVFFLIIAVMFLIFGFMFLLLPPESGAHKPQLGTSLNIFGAVLLILGFIYKLIIMTLKTNPNHYIKFKCGKLHVNPRGNTGWIPLIEWQESIIMDKIHKS